MKRKKRSSFIISLLAILIVFCTVYLPSDAEAEKSGKDLPLPVRMVLHKVNGLMEKKDYKRAVQAIMEFQARGGPVTDPNAPDPKGYRHPEVYYSLGNCYMKQERYEPAIIALRMVVKREPGHAFAWLNLARACYEKGDYAEAGRCFIQGYDASEKKEADYLYYSAVAHLMAEQYDRSIVVFERLFKTHFENIKPEWKENLVHALLANDQPRRALPHIKDLIHCYAGDKKVRWLEILLSQYLQLDMHAEALDLALKLTREYPTVAKWWKALAHIELTAERYQESLVSMTIYGWLTPLNTEEQRLLADLHLQLGIPVKAVPLYEEMLRHKPNKQVLKNLAAAYRLIDRPEAALRKIEKFKGHGKRRGFVNAQGRSFVLVGTFSRPQRTLI